MAGARPHAQGEKPTVARGAAEPEGDIRLGGRILVLVGVVLLPVMLLLVLAH